MKVGERGAKAGEREGERWSQRSLKKWKKREREGVRGKVSPAGLCGWLCAPTLLGGRGWLNKQS